MTKFTQMAANEDGGASRRIHLREISGDSDAPLETVGQDLRAARIRRGDDLATVSRSLKIRKDHLDALEADRFDDLPGKTYAIGFVRSYARYLGLDAAELAERFKAEISGRSEDPALALAMIYDDDSQRLPYGWRILAGVIILALVYGAWHIFFAARDTTPAVPSPPRLAQAEAPRPAEAKPAPPTNSQQQQSAATPPMAAANPVATVSPAVGTQAGAPAPQAIVPAVPDTAASPQSNQVFGAQSANARVVLRARGATRITVKGRDGKIWINRDLAPGEVYNVPNIPGLSMALSNAGALEVDLDGISLGRAGADHEVLGRVSLDYQSLADRFNTH